MSKQIELGCLVEVVYNTGMAPDKQKWVGFRGKVIAQAKLTANHPWKGQIGWHIEGMTIENRPIYAHACFLRRIDGDEWESFLAKCFRPINLHVEFPLAVELIERET